MSLKTKGITLIETLFAFSLYTICIISFISMYNISKKQLIDQYENYEQYIDFQNSQEKEKCFDDLTNLHPDSP